MWKRVRAAGVEPARVSPTEFKSVASAVPPRPHCARIWIPAQQSVLRNGHILASETANHLVRRFCGAEDGIRTRDLLLGKEMLYH